MLNITFIFLHFIVYYNHTIEYKILSKFVFLDLIFHVRFVDRFLVITDSRLHQDISLVLLIDSLRHQTSINIDLAGVINNGIIVHLTMLILSKGY